jgi:hypothetical protein
VMFLRPPLHYRIRGRELWVYTPIPAAPTEATV